MSAPETTNLIYTIQKTPARVEHAVASVLQEQVGIPSDEPLMAHRGVTKNVEFVSACNIAPRWISVAGIFDMANEVSSSSVWKQLLSEVTPGTQARIAVEYNSTEPESAIAKKNARFVTSAISLGLLAAAIGSRVGECVAYESTNLNVDFVLQMGADYQTAPRDGDDFMGRVSQLLPNPDTGPADGKGTLINYFTEYDTFTRPFRATRCPATYFTGLVLGQMGRQLDSDPIYRKRFETKIIEPVTTVRLL